MRERQSFVCTLLQAMLKMGDAKFALLVLFLCVVVMCVTGYGCLVVSEFETTKRAQIEALDHKRDDGGR